MKKRYLTIARLVISFSIGFYLNIFLAKESTIDNKVKTKKEKTSNMKLGTFSISLSVKDLKASEDFYEKLGFNAFAGSMEQTISL